MGRSNKFTSYDSVLRQFRTQGDLVERVDLGTHIVVIKATFTSVTGRTLIFQESFSIVVNDK